MEQPARAGFGAETAGLRSLTAADFGVDITNPVETVGYVLCRAGELPEDPLKARLIDFCHRWLREGRSREAQLHVARRRRAHSEDLVPTAARWWDLKVERYVAWGREEKGWTDGVVEGTRRCLLPWPERFEAAGLGTPEHVEDIDARMLLAWKRDPWGPGHYSRTPRRMKQTSAFQALHVLRGFARWTGAPIASKDAIWKSQRGDATNRRWLPGGSVDLLRLFEACVSQRERLVVALAGYAGLRRAEIQRLRAGDVQCAIDRPSMVVTRKGGRRQELQICGLVANTLRVSVIALPVDELVYPASYNVIDRDLRRIGARIGIYRISCHDLRRTFGRVLYYEHRVDPNQIRVLYGHRDLAQTLYYIGADEDDLRAAVQLLDPPRPPPPLQEAV